ncbi:HNH endonuclease [Bradyrhizobium elkanii]|uniref:HNH endonuclease n=1 Tax=Bradyrhizobium elkanii TaxID=29448 RepID=UPI002711F1B0|nr:HNH endonuclease [Bradyrhizobium elkanii]WLA36178.1 HNH endonuclease [Bradyrhizobium elkanii]
MGIAHHDRRWSALRLQAKRRDGFACVQCGAVHRLEVDHIKPARHAPQLAYDLTNLQTLCSRCHREKTAIETGIAPFDPRRLEWRDLLKQKDLKCLLA